MGSALLVFGILALLLIVAALFFKFGRERWWASAIGSLCSFAFVMLLCLWGPLLPSLFDKMIAYKLELPVEIPGYTVTLNQEPGSDFYNTTFRVHRKSDGMYAIVSYDNDDYRWTGARTKEREGKIYFLRGGGGIDKRTSYVDPEEGVLYSGYHQTAHDFADLNWRK